MAGTLTISTLSDGTNSTSSTNCIQGSAKAWVSFGGTGTATIKASYNVSSVTYVGTGSYTVNFTVAFADAKYAATGGLTQVNNASTNSFMSIGGSGSTAPTTSAFSFQAFIGGTNYDALYASVAFFR